MLQTTGTILITALVFLLVSSFVLSISRPRHQKLAEVTNDLEVLKKKARPDQQYAIDENIAFFKAIKTLPGYLVWGVTRRKRIDADKLLEIADLPLPRWEKELYDNLNQVERRNFPGLTKPLRKLLVSLVKENTSSIMLDLGCGGMEAERQALVELKKAGIDHRTVFVGIDLAAQAWDSINENLAELSKDIEIRQITSLENISKYQGTTPLVLFMCGDALELAHAHAHQFSLVFSSRFKHHLDKKQKHRIEKLYKEKANHAIEYDDYSTAISWLPPILTAWYKPILLNGSIFSQIRQPSKQELKIAQKETAVKFFSPPGSYAKVYSKSDKVLE